MFMGAWPSQIIGMITALGPVDGNDQFAPLKFRLDEEFRQ